MHVKTKTYVVYGHIVRVSGHPREGTIARIGYTGDLTARTRQHERDALLERDKRLSKKGPKSKGGWHFYNAIRKYGFENFELVILRRCKTLEEALKWEARLIRKHRTMRADGGYNEIKGGQASPMTDPSVIEKMKLSCAAVWSDPGWRQRQGAVARTVWSDMGLRAKHSHTIKEAWEDPELKAVRSSLSQELWKAPEVRERISANMSKTWSCPNRRARQSTHIKAAWASRPELRRWKADQVRAMWRDPAYRRRQMVSRRASRRSRRHRR